MNYRFPKSKVVHGSREKGLLTWCGRVFVDLFWSYEAGRMLAEPVEDPVTCRSCLRAK